LFQGYNQDADRCDFSTRNLRWQPSKSFPMTEAVIAATTPLATLLTQSAAPPELAAYRGALTPWELDAPERETAALASGAAAHDLGWLRRVAVQGEDRFRWLSGMVTNTVNELGANSGAWNLVLNAQGRIQGDLHVWREDEQVPLQQDGPVAGEAALDLEVAADQYDRLLAHLDHFIIMDDVELTPRSEETALGLAGPLAADVLVRLGLPAPAVPLTSARGAWNGQAVRVARAYGVLTPHFELWVQTDRIPALWQALAGAGTSPVGAASLEAFRIAEGIPVYGIDMAERDLPQETSQMRAISFNKGCYLGQEIVERIRSRGSVHRHLRALELSGPAPEAGTELTTDGGAAAGQMTSAAELRLGTGNRVFALGMMRGEAEISPQSFNYTAGTASGTARILALPPSLEPVESLSRVGSDI
jgi:folate-binding protein YgfZ